jgi:methylmalonyl-CoA mutase C-terminal domain/subunit
LKEKGADDITVIGGGIIPQQDFQKLYDAGIKAIFVPGTTLDTIVNWVNSNVKPVERK